MYFLKILDHFPIAANEEMSVSRDQLAFSYCSLSFSFPLALFLNSRLDRSEADGPPRIGVMGTGKERRKLNLEQLGREWKELDFQ